MERLGAGLLSYDIIHVRAPDKDKNDHLPPGPKNDLIPPGVFALAKL